MKKILVALICFSLMSSNFVFAELIKDDLAEQLDKNLKINKFSKTLIEDDFAQKTINPKLRVQKIKSQKVNDEFVLNSLNQNSKIKKQTTSLLKDNKVETTRKIVDRNKYKNVANNDFSYGKIKVQPKQYYTTRTNLQEGKYIDFVLAEDIKIKNTLYKKGTQVKARVETLSQNGAYGVPADLVVGNFVLGDNLLNGQIARQGANRSLWVYPTSYVLMPFFFMGALFLPIRGGHVKLMPKKIYEIEI